MMADSSSKNSSNVQIVAETIAQVLREAGKSAPQLDGNCRVLGETGLDSLGLAEVVMRLEDKFGRDPFENGFIHFGTIEELARLYDG